jgi:hypothetical protein
MVAFASKGKEDWLDEEHSGDANSNDGQQNHFDLCLLGPISKEWCIGDSRRLTQVEEHVDHGSDN